MFKFEDLKQIHLEITNNCQASCPMCSRNVNGGLENPLIKIKDWSIEDFKKIISIEVLNQIEGFYFCGTFGDPMMNNDLIKMCQYSKEINPKIRIHIHTNGGARNSEWWERLAKALPEDHLVVFGIDGLEDTNHLYRVGVNFKSLMRNVKAFIAAGGKAQWAFIRFKHNEHQLEQAREMSKELGFHSFHYKESSRFILEPRVKVVNRSGMITHYIEPSTDTPLKFIDKKAIENYKSIVDRSVIDCVVSKSKEVYIDAHGDFYACCWLANTPYAHVSEDAAFEVRTRIKEQHQEMIKKLGEINTLKRSIKDIINSNEYQTLWGDMWDGENKNIICSKSCGKHPDNEFSKCIDQFVEVTEFDE